MDKHRLIEKFERIGARVKVHPDLASRLSIDVERDRQGECFVVRANPDLCVEAIDVRPRQRHLLLAVREQDRLGIPVGRGERFLCGHDERAWFVAAIPESRAASNVDEAMDALRPAAVRQAMAQRRVPFGHRHRRKTAAFVRQGEWFFVPAGDIDVPADQVLRNEPLMRSGGKPHIVEFLCRDGGETVYVNAKSRQVISPQAFARLVRRNPRAAGEWLRQQRNMAVLVRGRIKHPDHKPIVLREWHQVFMNTEDQSLAMRHVAFID